MAIDTKPVSYLSRRGNDILMRARQARREGIIDGAFLSDVESVLLDGYEALNGTIEQQLNDAGVGRICKTCGELLNDAPSGAPVQDRTPVAVIVATDRAYWHKGFKVHLPDPLLTEA